MKHQWDELWLNLHLCTMEKEKGYGEIHHGALATQDGKIAWVGRQSDLPKHVAAQVFDGEGQWMTPGLIDCHTHIVYAGNRSNEFEARLNGVAYEEIARQGGGILSTVKATREARFEDLLKQSLPRVFQLKNEGVTTLEIKSGYGLDLINERKMLQVARKIGELLPLCIKTTFLGAHAVPPEFKDRPDDYISYVCEDMLPVLHAEGLVDAVDAFCEHIGFSLAQTRRVFESARKLGLPVKLHAEQLSDQKGAALVAKYKGLSADHLEFLSASGIQAMKQSNTVAVLLPGAFYFLRETQYPPIELLRKAKIPIAVSTDCNPGTSPMSSLLLAMNMATVQFKLTPQEALLGCTRYAAQALGLLHDRGTLTIGKRADLALWQIERPADLCYTIGFNPCTQAIKAI